MAMALDTLRVGHRYRMKNYGEVREFEILRRISDTNYEVRDGLTRETFEIEDLVRYGRGKDYDLDEIDEGGRVI